MKDGGRTEQRFVDKSGWGAGPWQEEPDLIRWVDEPTGLDCEMRRHPRDGHWCGYVAVRAGHPAHGKPYSDVDVVVHGGLTFDAPRDDLWWLGFDCHHAWDIAPGFEARERERGYPGAPDKQYRDREYVERETRALARQLAEMAA